jgi:CRP-like cAMP-binding protein
MPTSNTILSSLSPDDILLLEPHLEQINLPLRRRLEASGRRITHVYFLDSGFASVVANGATLGGVEVGIIGREGMSGMEIILADDDRADHDVYMQAAGAGRRIIVADLRKAIDQSPTLHRALLRFSRSFLRQISLTALAYGRNRLEERLARWLLMAHDRVDGDLSLTHEFLSLMLGVRRSGVTTAIQELERKALISHKRGVIQILDRAGLEVSANGTYLAPYKA